MAISPGNSVPLAIYSGGSASGRYSNVVIEIPPQASDNVALEIGNEKATDGRNVAGIDLVEGRARELFVSPDYVVYSGTSREVQADGPFVTVTFLLGGPGIPGTAPAGSNLIITRNGVEVKRVNIQESDPNGIYRVELKRVGSSTDAVLWRIEDASGKPISNGGLAFPVRGAAPKEVIYFVTTTGN